MKFFYLVGFCVRIETTVTSVLFTLVFQNDEKWNNNHKSAEKPMRYAIIKSFSFVIIHFFLRCQFGGEKDDGLNWALGFRSRYCTLGDGTNFFKQLGHTPPLQPVCHIVAFFIAGSGKRSISNCIPADVFGQYSQIAKQMDEQINRLVNETESNEETAWANVGLNVFHAIATIANAVLWLKIPRAIQLTTADNPGTMVRRARQNSID